MSLFPLSADKVQLTTAVPVASDAVVRSILLNAGNTLVRASLTGGLTFANGLSFTALGQMVYLDATAGLPAGAQFVNGLPLAATGELCISTGATTNYSNGVPFAANGAVSAAVAP